MFWSLMSMQLLGGMQAVGRVAGCDKNICFISLLLGWVRRAALYCEA